MYKTLTLKNDFHSCAVSLLVKHSGPVEVNDIIELSPGQIKKSQKALCGLDNCQCSGELGERAEWHKLGDREVKLSVDVQSDRNGKTTRAVLAVEKIWQ